MDKSGLSKIVTWSGPVVLFMVDAWVFMDSRRTFLLKA